MPQADLVHNHPNRIHLPGLPIQQYDEHLPMPGSQISLPTHEPALGSKCLLWFQALFVPINLVPTSNNQSDWCQSFILGSPKYKVPMFMLQMHILKGLKRKLTVKRCPSLLIHIEWSPPHATWVTFWSNNALTRTGLSKFCVLPCPSWPYFPRPHVKTYNITSSSPFARV